MTTDPLVAAILAEPSCAVSRLEAEKVADAVRMTIEKQPLAVSAEGKGRHIDWPTRVFSLALQLATRGKK